MRKKTDDELRQNGTWRQDRHSQHDPTGYLLQALPDPPRLLPKDALLIYNDAGSILIAQKMLKASDIELLVLYALELSIYHKEMALANGQLVEVFSNGNTGISTHRKAAIEALKQTVILGEKLGLSPASRAKLKGSVAFKDEQPQKKVDPMIEILKPRSKN